VDKNKIIAGLKDALRYMQGDREGSRTHYLCLWCGSTSLVSPEGVSETDLEENWWCNTCTDYVPDPQGYRESLKPVGQILREEKEKAREAGPGIKT